MEKMQLQVNIPVTILREKKRFVAYTPALDLSTSGKNFKEAKKRFSEIVVIFLEELIKNKTLDIVLEDLGWEKIQKKWHPPVMVGQGSENIKIPIRL